LWFYGKIFQSDAAIFNNIHLLKILVVTFDFASLYLLIKILKHFKINPLKSVFVLFNIAYFYDTLVWGQVDSIHTFLAFAAIYLFMKGKNIGGVALFIMAMNMKTQAFVFLPFVIYFLYKVWKENNLNFLKIFIIGIAFQIILILPFIVSNNLLNLTRNVFSAFSRSPVLSMNAHNIWYLFFIGNPMKISDTLNIGFMTYKQSGIILFLLFSAIIFYPWFHRIIFHKWSLNFNNINDQKILFLTVGLMVMFFFFFNTEMHERYIHPAIIFLGLYAILSNSYFIYVLVSLAYFLNMDFLLCHTPKIFIGWLFSHEILLPRLVASIYLISMFIGIYGIYTMSGILKRKKAAGK
jgi:Gpi18-like mannosyltransferase